MGTEGQRKMAAKKRLLKTSPVFKQVAPDAPGFPDFATRAFSNNKYLVTVDDNSTTTHGPAIRAMVQKFDDTPILNHWSEMQKIKNELFGKETMAIEYYPAESQLRNTHNIYWLWIFPPGVIPMAL